MPDDTYHLGIITVSQRIYHCLVLYRHALLGDTYHLCINTCITTCITNVAKNYTFANEAVSYQFSGLHVLVAYSAVSEGVIHDT